jgi:predicted RND superfamily exporter protein
MRFENFIIKYRGSIIIISVLVTVLAAIPLFHTTIDSDLRAYLPADMPSQVNTDKIEELFGSTDPVLLVFESDDILNPETLKRIKGLSKEFNKRKEFEHVLSLFDSKEIKGENGAMIVDPAVKRIPKTEKRRKRLRKSIKNNELVYKLIVSEDFRYTLMMINIKKGVSDMVSLPIIDSLINAYPGKAKVYKAGEPYLRTTINDDISGDMSLLLPIGLLIMIVFLYLSFKEKRGVILPFLVVAMSIVVSMGLIPLFGWKISLLTVLVPIMMIAMANDYGVHFIAAYQERNLSNPEWTMQQIVADTLKHLKKPVIVTALTTAAGILALLAHVMIPARQVGVVASIGISFALILSLFFLPAILAGLKKGKPQKNLQGNKKTILIRILASIGSVITKNPKKVLIGSLVFTVILGLGIFKIQVDSNTENILPKDHPFRQASDILNEYFGGTKNISILFKGDIKDPKLMKKLDDYETELKKMPQVGQAASIATVVRIISKAINDKNDIFYDKIPDSREAIAQYLELYQMSGDPDDFEQLVDFNYSKAVLNIQVKANDNKAIKEVLAKVNELTTNNSNMKIIGGFCLVVNDLADAIIKGQTYSLALAILIIALLLMLIFRSVVAGLIGSIPLVITIIILFGSMGYLGVKLDIVTALLSSIVVGAGVDYTIHFLWRYKEERINGKTGNEAVILTLVTTGRGITINALSVIIGFIALFVSAFVSLKYFAFLIIFSIFFCLLTALIVVPALCLVFKPKFLEPKVI